VAIPGVWGRTRERPSMHSAGTGTPMLDERSVRSHLGCYRVRGARTPMRTSKFSGGTGLGGTGR
jgi:hypothetical protein